MRDFGFELRNPRRDFCFQIAVSNFKIFVLDFEKFVFEFPTHGLKSLRPTRTFAKQNRSSHQTRVCPSKNKMRLDRQTLYLIIGGLVIVLLGVVVYTRSNSGKKSKTSKNEDFGPKGVEGTSGQASNSKAEFILFWATWCGNCTVIKPEWEKLMEKVGGRGIDMIESADERANASGITAYPTMRFYPNGLEDPKNFEEYRGARTLAGISEFYDSHMK